MPNVAVNRIADVGKTPAPLLQEIQDYLERVRRKAFEIFESNGGAHGYDVEHWLEAEREIRGHAAPEIAENGNEFEIAVPVASLEPTAIEVSALPVSIVITGKTGRQEEQQEEDGRFAKWQDERISYCITLPEPIAVDSARATLEKGNLRIVAQKASSPARSVQVAA